ncbi:MAG: hypothetical protein JO256_08150 [Alphaproteobacteria bacterium]|nr:hypothetical protein [Alphaproteobacteria bacterium]
MKRGLVWFVAAALLPVLPAAAQDRSMAPDWITASNQPCKIWNPSPQPNESVTWSGGCKDGLASGRGVLRWTENGKPDAQFDGEYANGKRNGPGVLTLPDGRRQSGVWANDEEVPFRSGTI